jgi:hypothetical protein
MPAFAGQGEKAAMSKQKPIKGPWDDFFDHGPWASKDFLESRNQPLIELQKPSKTTRRQNRQLVEIAHCLGADVEEETFKGAIHGITKEKPEKAKS